MKRYGGCVPIKVWGKAVTVGAMVMLALVSALGLSVAYANDGGCGDASNDATGERAGGSLVAQANVDFYAVLHADGELVFQREARDIGSSSSIDVVYEGDIAGYTSAARVPWLKSAAKIASVRFAGDFARLQPESLAYWFSGCSNMRSIDLANLDASQSISMRQMFLDCSSLVEVNSIEDFDTSSSTYFGGMFRNCSSLKSLDVSHFDATHVGVLCFMFNGCSSLEELNMAGEGWRTSSLYLMVHVWENCSSLKSLDLSYLDTSGAHSMASDFKGCTSLEYLDLSGADTTQVGTLTSLFDGCENLKTVKLGAKFTFNGAAASRQCQLPEGNWRSSATGELYASSQVPNCIAATYAKEDSAAWAGEAGGARGEDGNAQGEAAGKSSEAGGGQAEAAEGGKTPSEDAGKQKPAPTASGLPVGGMGKSGGVKYKVLANGKAPAATVQKAPKDKARVVIPKSVALNGKRYAVIGIAKGALSGAKAKTLVIKSQTLDKRHVAGCFKGARELRAVKVPPSCAKLYEKLFKKPISGKRVIVA